MLRIIVACFCMFLSLDARADTNTGYATNFTGPNIYSPTVLHDLQESNYKMWYGGWQISGQQSDHIYYKNSSDGVNWPSGYIEVLTPDFVAQRYAATTGNSVSIVHVNDPSVTKHFNATSQTYQYTMFFTVCSSPGIEPCESIWSIVSGDGVDPFTSPCLRASDWVG